MINTRTFDADKIYRIHQVDAIYPHDVPLSSGDTYHEDTIGCNHRCLFCGYTWHRKQSEKEAFKYSGLWHGGEDRERAIIDMYNGQQVDLRKLRTTAIDGMRERIRMAVNKRITREMLREFVRGLARMERPHQIKLYNIIGYPTETEEDWDELLEDVCVVDSACARREKQTCLLVHSTPFRAMPGTPMACAPMSLRNYRGEVARRFGQGRYKGNICYSGNSLWMVESMGTESLATVAESAIVWRGTEDDADAVAKVALSKKYRRASQDVRLATLDQYFDLTRLFGRYTPDDLPTKYLRTYCKVERMWGRTPLER